MSIVGMTLALAVQLTGPARAEQGSHVVIHDGDLPEALEQVSNDTGVDKTRLDGRRPTELVGGDKPLLAGTATISACTAESIDNDAFRSSVNEATELWFAMDTAAALARVESSLQKLPCIHEPLEPSMAAQAAFLLGALRAAQGDESGARVAFDQALRIKPTLVWNPDVPPDAQPLFNQVQAEQADTPRTTLQVIPGDPGAVPLRVDGQSPVGDPNALKLAAGPHLIQVLGATTHTMLATFEPDGHAWLIVPSQIDDTWAARADEPQYRRALQGLVHAAQFSDTTTVYVPGKDGTWQYTPSSRAWQRTTRPLGDRLRNPLLIGGGVALATGAVFMTITAVKASSIEEDIRDDQAATAPSLSTRSYQQKVDALATQRRWYWVGAGVASAGVIALGTGTWLSIKHRNRSLSIAPMGLIGGMGLAVHGGLPQ